jgi:arabinose-5-phosphate isomerase
VNSNQTITDSARNTLLLESEAIAKLVDYINADFEEIVRVILDSKGRLIITGIGKSANIANKIVATLNSTGTPAVFMHAADAIHGDLGTVQEDDMVLCISKSGSSPEIEVLLPLVKGMGNLLIGMVGDTDSFLAKKADHVINTHVEKEACPNNLAPTTSTAAQLAMGDALAVALMECRGFTSRDFAKYHPGGALGKKLYTRLSDLLTEDNNPQVRKNTPIKDVIIEISSKRLGASAVIDNSEIVGIITDGDVRRMLQQHDDLSTLTASDIMSENPKILDQNSLVVDAFQIMESNNITQVIVADGNKYAGIVHLHDILKEGIY